MVRRPALFPALRPALALALVPFAGCGAPGAAAREAAPPRPTYAEASGADTCGDVSGSAQPLVVDARPELRADLEVAMKRGVAVVAYDCKRLVVLADCRLEGTYGFVGTSRKEQVLEVKDADELHANLPVSSAKLRGAIARGASIDVGLVIVGKRMSTRRSVTREDLGGGGGSACAGATHVVSGATLGAFAMKTAARAEVRTAAELFGVGGGASSDTSRGERTSDGSLEACKSAKPDAPAPPDDCAAILRLDLAPIAAARVGAGAQGEPLAPSCPAPLVWRDGLCAQPAGGPHVCKLGDLPDCTAQCAAGSARSCTTLGVMALEGRAMQADDKAAASRFEEACTRGDATGCSNLGLLLEDGKGVASDVARATKLFGQACDDGEPAACVNLGEQYSKGIGAARDLVRAASLYERACNAGSPNGCNDFGAFLALGKGVPQDRARAASILERACQGDDARGCTNAGVLVKDTDRDRARSLFRKACAAGDDEGCAWAKKL